MRVDVRIDAALPEAHAVLNVPKLTAEIAELVEVLENAGGAPRVITAKRDDKSYIIEPEQAEMLRTEGGGVALYDREARAFAVALPLHEAQRRLGEDFFRVSKSCIVNMRRIDHVASSFNGTMDIIMKNGMSDYISRKYLGEFKKRLGM